MHCVLKFLKKWRQTYHGKGKKFTWWKCWRRPLCERSICSFLRLPREIYEKKLFIFAWMNNRSWKISILCYKKNSCLDHVADLFQARRLSNLNNYTTLLLSWAKQQCGQIWQSHQQSTVETIVKKEVPLKITGHQKLRLSVCLSARADGTKLESMIVFGGVKHESEALNKEFGSRGVVVSSPSGWMNESLMRYWKIFTEIVSVGFLWKSRNTFENALSSRFIGNSTRLSKICAGSRYFVEQTF